MPLDDAAASGDRLATLRELRDVLAVAIVRTRDGRDIAALTGRLTAVLDKIAQIEPGKGTALDEFIKRRADRATPRTASPEAASATDADAVPPTANPKGTT